MSYRSMLGRALPLMGLPALAIGSSSVGPTAGPSTRSLCLAGWTAGHPTLAALAAARPLAALAAARPLVYLWQTARPI